VYDALPAPARERWVALLRQHPRFDQDFAAQLPADVTADADRARWIFLRAAVWPDLARGQPAFERRTWHYVNLPLTLSKGTLVTCQQARADFPESRRRVAAAQAQRKPTERAAPTAPEPGAELTPSEPDDIVSALAWAQQTLRDGQRPAPQRAIALSWLLHLVGDAHQPLHGVALFTARRFELGDRGGNEIQAGAERSLHQLWDGLLGEDTSLGFVQRQARRWQQSAELRALGKAARQSLDVEAWLDEDCALARSHVYSAAVLSAVQGVERSSADTKPEATLDTAYYQRGRRAAERRAAQASARLTALLERVAL
jgi:hypothetical protein